MNTGGESRADAGGDGWGDDYKNVTVGCLFGGAGGSSSAGQLLHFSYVIPAVREPA